MDGIKNFNNLLLLLFILVVSSCSPDYTTHFQKSSYKRSFNNKSASNDSKGSSDQHFTSIKDKIKSKGYSIKQHHQKLEKLTKIAANNKNELSPVHFKKKVSDIYKLDENEVDELIKHINKQDKKIMIDKLEGFNKMMPERKNKTSATKDINVSMENGIILIGAGIIISLLGVLLLTPLQVLFGTIAAVLVTIGVVFIILDILDQ